MMDCLNYALCRHAKETNESLVSREQNLTETYAPVKLFCPIPPEQPRGQRKYACDKKGRGTKKRVILVII